LDGLYHAPLKNHPKVATALQQFWDNPTIAPISTDTASKLIAKLRSLDLTETNNQNFVKSKVIQTYSDGIKLWTWTNSFQIIHVFISIGNQCVYSAYTGWQGKNKLAIALKTLY
jgi:hypothetical protein